MGQGSQGIVAQPLYLPQTLLNLGTGTLAIAMAEEKLALAHFEQLALADTLEGQVTLQGKAVVGEAQALLLQGLELGCQALALTLSVQRLQRLGILRVAHGHRLLAGLQPDLETLAPLLEVTDRLLGRDLAGGRHEGQTPLALQHEGHGQIGQALRQGQHDRPAGRRHGRRYGRSRIGAASGAGRSPTELEGLFRLADRSLDRSQRGRGLGQRGQKAGGADHPC